MTIVTRSLPPIAVIAGFVATALWVAPSDERHVHRDPPPVVEPPPSAEPDVGIWQARPHHPADRVAQPAVTFYGGDFSATIKELDNCVGTIWSMASYNAKADLHVRARFTAVDGKPKTVEVYEGPTSVRLCVARALETLRLHPIPQTADIDVSIRRIQGRVTLDAQTLTQIQ